MAMFYLGYVCVLVAAAAGRARARAVADARDPADPALRFGRWKVRWPPTA